MKNVKVFLVGLVAALAVSASASQPIVPGHEANPFRVNAGIGTGMGSYQKDGKGSFGFNRLGAGLGFSHYVGHDFQYNVGVGGSWASMGGHKIFGDNLKGESYKGEGFHVGADIGANYLPRIADNLHVGGLVDVSFGRLFGKAASEKVYKNWGGFGDLGFAVGPALNYGFSAGSFYAAATYGITAMRFGGTPSASEKEKAFRHTVRIPLGGLFNINDNTGIFAEVTPSWASLGKDHKFSHGIGVCAAAGVSFTM